MPTSVDRLRIYLGIDPASTVDTEAMGMAVDAANKFVERIKPEWCTEATWEPDAEQAATVQAARLYGRRGSVQGVAAFADIGVSLLPRLDPEVRSLLRLGEYQDSTVA